MTIDRCRGDKRSLLEFLLQRFDDGLLPPQLSLLGLNGAHEVLVRLLRVVDHTLGNIELVSLFENININS